MAGIFTAAAHIPYLKIERKTIGGAWERGAQKGCRSVAGSDEDSLTMAAEAAGAALEAGGRDGVQALYFASTTAPYKEKATAAMLATVLDLGGNMETLDLGNSLRSGLGALKLALDTAGDGKVLVASGEKRLGYPRSDQEQLFGDAGAAVLVGGGDAPVAYLGGYAVTDEINDVWRTQEDTYVQSWEGRFVTGEGYLRVTAQAVKGLMSKMGLKSEDIAKAIIPAPDPRSAMGILKKTGLNDAGQAVDSLLETVGFCGTAHPLVMMAAVLEQAQPGEKILVAAYGDGAQALLFEVKAQPVLPAVSVLQQLESRRAINSYARFLSFNGLVEPQPGEPFRLVPSATVTWRERDSLLRCRGSKCRECGTAAFPIQRICDNCRSVDQFDTVRLSGMAGEVFTFSRDNLAGRPDDPVIVQTVVQMENGARFYGLMTDADPTSVELGTPVKLTLRRMHDLGGFHNYFWKCRPVR
ncbi:MAG: hypothetical protein K9K36_10875 [Desulfarculaceae bacterium]|nr:hypothetical protein [Desulfarculaceae bacterium]MCF8046186.1 hypothetical protein [Desulfarculaceae bacterium]MCF8065739.1 hypothetical protein [Desulfarculaceae bacterium]MCF8121482.1 hypothetical protein [Desulfarculaceae bacterium]